VNNVVSYVWALDGFQFFLTTHFGFAPPPMTEDFDQGDLASVEGAYQPKNILITGGAGFMSVAFTLEFIFLISVVHLM
jgi:hypothetical protein